MTLDMPRLPEELHRARYNEAVAYFIAGWPVEGFVLALQKLGYTPSMIKAEIELYRPVVAQNEHKPQP